MTYADSREGPGRWSIINHPEGILWTNDRDSVGFVAAPVPGIDRAPLDNQIAMAFDAGRTPTEAFDVIAAACGHPVEDGDLSTWRKNTMRHRPMMRPEPQLTVDEIKDATL